MAFAFEVFAVFLQDPITISVENERVVIAERLQLPFLTGEPDEKPALDVRQVTDNQLFAFGRFDATA